ncbi:MAG: radical SAM protein [Candidatus Marinimicrobia bacterium]|nr:radical SAM protein [Candidatus Neomarinimicrobiota bacterium]
MNETGLVFGPVPSRRLGRSLGINNIPPKICTYACVYCQVGNTIRLQVDRQYFFSPAEIFQEVSREVRLAHAAGETIDYLTFVPDGEPTLDLRLGESIATLQSLAIPIAVISNGSLITSSAVREDLKSANWVSLKVDAVTEKTWRRVNRPHGRLVLKDILESMLIFRDQFPGDLATESMLVGGYNDDLESIEKTARFLEKLKPSTAYISIPTRPPAIAPLHPPPPDRINTAYQIFSGYLDSVELITGYEGNAFSSTGDCKTDILNITAVHPMRADAVEALLQKNGDDWQTIHALWASGRLQQASFNGYTYFLRVGARKRNQEKV